VSSVAFDRLIKSYLSFLLGGIVMQTDIKEQILSFNFKYHSDYRYLCLKNCIKQLLDFYNVSNSSLLINSAVEVAAVFDLNDYGFGFVDSNIICPLQPEINKNALKFFSDSSPDKAWEANKTAIKTKPIIVLTDIYHLKFRNEYLKQHGAHFIILFYYDELSNSVGVLDWYEPHFYKGEILLNDFLSARYSENNFSNNPFSKLNQESTLKSILFKTRNF